MCLNLYCYYSIMNEMFLGKQRLIVGHFTDKNKFVSRESVLNQLKL